MRRDEKHVFGGFEADLNEIPAVQSQNGPPVRLQDFQCPPTARSTAPPASKLDINTTWCTLRVLSFFL